MSSKTITQNDLTNISIRKQMKTTDFAKESIEQLKLIEMRRTTNDLRRIQTI